MSNATLPVASDSSAPLPQRYEAARAAIAECDRVDECKTWSDKAAALASYARQAKDDSLALYARRIQARAMRRAGELLKQIPSGQGSSNQHIELPVGTVTRQQAAADAGLSERQRVTALRVASISAEDFDHSVESPNPPTITRLAEQGTISRPEGPSDAANSVEPSHTRPLGGEDNQAKALKAFGDFKAFTDFCDAHDPAVLAKAMPVEYAVMLRRFVERADSWLDRFVTALPLNPVKIA